MYSKHTIKFNLVHYIITKKLKFKRCHTLSRYVSESNQVTTYSWHLTRVGEVAGHKASSPLAIILIILGNNLDNRHFHFTISMYNLLIVYESVNKLSIYLSTLIS